MDLACELFTVKTCLIPYEPIRTDFTFTRFAFSKDVVTSTDVTFRGANYVAKPTAWVFTGCVNTSILLS